MRADAGFAPPTRTCRNAVVDAQHGRLEIVENQRLGVNRHAEQLADRRNSPPSITLDDLVAHKGEILTVGGPRGNIDRALAAKQFGDDSDGAGVEVHEAKRHILALRMVTGGHRFIVRKVNHLFAIGRDVGEPIIVVVICSWWEPSGCMRQICICPLRSELK